VPTNVRSQPNDASLRRFRPYPTYEHSGVVWLEQIPVHWKLKPLKHLTAFTTGWTPPTGRDDLYGGNHLWANIGDLGAKVLYKTEKMISDSAIREARLRIVETGSLLFSFKLSVGTVSIAGVDMYTNEAIAAFAPSERIDTRYLYWAAPVFLPRSAQENIYGAPLLNRDRIANARLLSPPIPEQRTIAAFLDRETTRIDGLVTKKERLIELLQEKRAALITRAVTNGLDPSVPMKDSGVEWLGEIPAHWKVGRLRDMADSLQTGPFGSQLHAGEYVPGGRPVINPANLRDGRLVPDWDSTVDEHTASRLERHALLAGDILFARRGELGRCGLVASHQEGWICGTGSLRLRLRRDLARPEFVLHSLSTQGVEEWLELQSVGATMLNLNTSIIGRIPVVLPSVTEQDEIVSRIEGGAHAIRALVAKVRECIDRLKELRAALISAAVTGKIDVRVG
jgi:type I restriction enzyme S subunit